MSMKDLKSTPEDEFNAIIDAIENRAMAADGPVTPTLQEATEEELSRLWELVNEISPKRKTLARKIGRIATATTEECKQYLRNEGLDPDEIAKEGVVFVKTVTRNIELTAALKQAKEALESIEDSFDNKTNYGLKSEVHRAVETINKLGI